MLEMDKKIIHNRGFYGYLTVCDLENRFSYQANKITLFTKNVKDKL